MARGLMFNIYGCYKEASYSCLFDSQADNFSKFSSSLGFKAFIEGKVDYREKLELLFMVDNLGFRFVCFSICLFIIHLCVCFLSVLFGFRFRDRDLRLVRHFSGIGCSSLYFSEIKRRYWSYTLGITFKFASLKMCLIPNDSF